MLETVGTCTADEVRNQCPLSVDWSDFGVISRSGVHDDNLKRVSDGGGAGDGDE